MGQNLSQDAKNITDIVNNSSTIISNKASSVANQNCIGDQNLTILAGQYISNGETKTCNFKINGSIDAGQSINNVCKLDSALTLEAQSTILNDFQTNVAESIDAAQKASSGWLSGLNGSQDLKGNYVNAVSISNLINNNISNTFEQTCSNSVLSRQSGYLSFCGKYKKDIKVNQNINQLGVESCIGEFISNTLTNSSVVNSVDLQIKARQEAVKKGLDDLFKWVAIAVGVLVVGAIIIGIIFLLVSKPKAPPASAVPAAGATPSPAAAGGINIGQLLGGGSGSINPQQILSLLGK